MADKIYKGQTALNIVLDTGMDLSTATSALIKYLKPDKTEGSWAATVDSPATAGKISYEIASASDLDQSGGWKMWAYITLPQGTVPGDCSTFTVYEEGGSCG